MEVRLLNITAHMIALQTGYWVLERFSCLVGEDFNYYSLEADTQKDAVGVKMGSGKSLG